MSKKRKKDYSKIDAAKRTMNDMFDTYVLVIDLNERKIKYGDDLFFDALYRVFRSQEQNNKKDGVANPEIRKCREFLEKLKRRGFKLSSKGEDSAVLVEGLMAMGQGFLVKPINPRKNELEYFLAITPRSMTKTIRQAYTKSLSTRVKTPQRSAG